ncbi:HsdM family class I SAM-dependent methyltransferase [Ruminiclostridium cellobioparum]|uniref:HsdM family class I SAM-dependent methyltransferase n=1 Tax=Ruminiclostridium cellobioparum TaxID=29355 RepID=UPI0028AA194B|nr:N-6 DNA methylase [Ruminiclostridium cellobioparum]
MENSDNSPIDILIQRLGYDNSPNLFYFKNITKGSFSLHTRKVLLELQPFAVYCIDNQPFVIFFEVTDSSSIKNLNKKIWNAQIPIAIFCTENSVEIFNGTSLNLDESMLIKISEQSLADCSEQSPFSYWEVTDPRFWNKYSSQYNAVTLNELLLQNIEALTNQLKEIYNISFATKLILRLIFIRFLIDRGVDLGYKNFSNDVYLSQNEFLKVVEYKEQLYKLFSHLKNKFNGNLFDLGNEFEDKNLTPDVFNLLARFLSGKERLANGQLALFSMYDFNIIPVELISNIYEILLGKEAQKEDKAFYTPHYLVDYIVKQTIMPYMKNNTEFKVLDPACGSGIFLVECYRQLIEAKLCNENSVSDKILVDTLKENIYGIDSNENAIDVTIFSLYLTVLDYKDPKTLVRFKLPDLKNQNLVHANFLLDDKLDFLKHISFNFILGNPPWGRVTDNEHKAFCKSNEFLELSEISKSFVYKIKNYCQPNTQCCFILPAKLLYNKKTKSKQFREFLLVNAEIYKIVELSSVVDLVFKNAKAPAVIAIFKYNNTNNLSNVFTHVSLKPSIFFKLFNIMVIEKNDIKLVKQSLLLDNDWAWKTLVYGTSWDFEVIKKLKNSFGTIGEVIDEIPSICYGTGIQDGDGKDDTSKLPAKRVFNSEGNIDHFYINLNSGNFSEIVKEKIHRTRTPELYIPPYCLVSKGIDPHNYKMRAVYTEEQFIYKETIFGIKGDKNNKELLLALVGLINSSFYAYLNLILGSSAGIDRRQRFTKDLLDYPIPSKDLDKIASLTAEIQSLSQSEELFKPQEDIDDKITELDDIILEAFNLQHNPFVNYALNVMIPQIVHARQPEQLLYKIVTEKDLIEYSEVFVNYFENIYTKVGKYILIKIYPQLGNNFTAFELIVADESVTPQICLCDDNYGVKRLLSKFSIYKYNDMFYQIRDVLYFEENSFFIIKTNEYKNWHPAIAQIDLAEVIDRILFEDGGGQ